MGAHLIENEFQSDKYPTCPAGKVPLSVKDPTAQDLLWEYAQRRRAVDAEFSDDLEAALLIAGYKRASGLRAENAALRALIADMSRVPTVCFTCGNRGTIDCVVMFRCLCQETMVAPSPAEHLAVFDNEALAALKSGGTGGV